MLKVNPDFSAWLGKRTLIFGDVNSGKTTLTREVLGWMCGQGLAARIAVIDLAPDIPEGIAAKKGLKGVGGKLIPPEGTGIPYLSSSIAPPRLTARSEEGALRIACGNAARIEVLLEEYPGGERDILFINDISMYLQAGEVATVKLLLEKARTVVANGYYGRILGTGVLSARERKKMEELKEIFHILVFLKDIKGNESIHK